MESNGYTWAQFNALPFELRDGAVQFWEPGYDYSDPDFWGNYETEDPDFIKAVQMYDWLQENAPEE